MSGFAAAAEVLPREYRAAALALSEKERGEAQEFRLRLGRCPTVVTQTGERRLSPLPVTPAHLLRVLELATLASPYAAADSVRRGFAAAPGGVRVGLCGRMRPGTEGAWAAAGLTSAAVRIPRQVKGCGTPFCAGPFVSTLILSPPGLGKTTLLRDMVRLLSDGGERVGLCDERGEVAALGDGGFGFDVGEHTDVITEGSKADAAMLLLRTMNPQILAMDEITDPEDAAACRRAAGCGVALLATAHAGCREELGQRRPLGELLEEGVFRRLIWINREGAGRSYREEWL